MTEHWLFPKIGLARYWAHRRNPLLNWPALIAWTGGIALALALHVTHALHLFFLFLPVCLFTAVLYIALASLAGARQPAPVDPALRPESATAASGSDLPTAAGPTRRGPLFWIGGLVAVAALIACIAMPLSVYAAGMDDYASEMTWFRRWLILPTFVYFIAGTLWQLQRMKRNT